MSDCNLLPWKIDKLILVMFITLHSDCYTVVDYYSKAIEENKLVVEADNNAFL